MSKGVGKGLWKVPLLAISIGLLLGIVGSIPWVDRPTTQPYPFNHLIHVAGADCVLCHQGARSQVKAGLPTLVVCTTCHATAPGENPGEADLELWRGALAGEFSPWNRLYSVPRHVFFSHRRHVGFAKIECSECHGEIKERTEPPEIALVNLKMRNCISCHEEERVTVDCTSCHR